MTTTKLKYEGSINDSTLLDMALFYGWTEFIPDPTDPTINIPNPVSYQDYACLNIIGMNFISLTVDRCCEPKRADIAPKDYPALIEATRTTILSTVTVTVNDIIVYPVI